MIKWCPWRGLSYGGKKYLPLREAIRKMTSLPAQTLRLQKRGLIREDFFADITIFNLSTIQDTATYQKPHQYPGGIEYVIVNGKIAALKGKPVPRMAGRVLYGRGKRRD